MFVAQLDSASDSDSEGRGFESRQTQTERSPETGFSFFAPQVQPMRKLGLCKKRKIRVFAPALTLTAACAFAFGVAAAPLCDNLLP